MYSLRCARSHVSPLERPVRRRVSVYIICDGWVAPFGYLRVKGCSHLTAAYRSVPRPSSPVYAKASTNCPYLTLENPHHHRQSCLHDRRRYSFVWFITGSPNASANGPAQLDNQLIFVPYYRLA